MVNKYMTTGEFIKILSDNGIDYSDLEFTTRNTTIVDIMMEYFSDPRLDTLYKMIYDDNVTYYTAVDAVFGIEVDQDIYDAVIDWASALDISEEEIWDAIHNATYVDSISGNGYIELMYDIN